MQEMTRKTATVMGMFVFLAVCLMGQISFNTFHAVDDPGVSLDATSAQAPPSSMMNGSFASNDSADDAEAAEAAAKAGERQPELAALAVCLYGEGARMYGAAESIRKHVIENYDADTFVSATRSKRSEKALEAAAWATLKNFSDSYHPERSFIEKFASRYSNVHGYFRNLAKRANTQREFIHFRQKLRGDNAYNGGGKYILRHHDVCRNMILDEEKRRGQPYAFIRIVRTDNYYRVDEVPLRLLNFTNPNGTCYSPHPEGDYNGYNGQGALCDRKGGLAFLDGARMISQRSSDVMDAFLRLSENIPQGEARWNRAEYDDDGKLKSLKANYEGFTRVRLEMAGVAVRRLPAVEFISCPRDLVAKSCLNINQGCRYDAEEDVCWRVYSGNNVAFLESRARADHVRHFGWDLAAKLFFARFPGEGHVTCGMCSALGV